MNQKKPQKKRLMIIFSAVIIFSILGYVGFLALNTTLIEAPVKSVDKEKKLPRMANLPPKQMNPEPIATTYSPNAPLIKQAREALAKGIEPLEAYQLAKSFPESPERDDARFLLLEYAAENDHFEAAYEVATFYDPLNPENFGTIQKNYESAYDWYHVASTSGMSKAQEKLIHLKSFVEKRAQQGDLKAKSLLTMWK